MVAFGAVAALMFAYGLWAIRSGYVHVGDRWNRVYRDKEPRSFWFTVVVFTMIVPVGIVGMALWELGFWGGVQAQGGELGIASPELPSP